MLSLTLLLVFAPALQDPGAILPPAAEQPARPDLLRQTWLDRFNQLVDQSRERFGQVEERLTRTREEGDRPSPAGAELDLRMRRAVEQAGLLVNDLAELVDHLTGFD